MRILSVDGEPGRRMILWMAPSIDPELDARRSASGEPCTTIARTPRDTLDA
jgi:hypothetical protein